MLNLNGNISVLLSRAVLLKFSLCLISSKPEQCSPPPLCLSFMSFASCSCFASCSPLSFSFLYLSSLCPFLFGEFFLHYSFASCFFYLFPFLPLFSIRFRFSPSCLRFLYILCLVLSYWPPAISLFKQFSCLSSVPHICSFFSCRHPFNPIEFLTVPYKSPNFHLIFLLI